MASNYNSTNELVSTLNGKHSFTSNQKHCLGRMAARGKKNKESEKKNFKMWLILDSISKGEEVNISMAFRDFIADALAEYNDDGVYELLSRNQTDHVYEAYNKDKVLVRSSLYASKDDKKKKEEGETAMETTPNEEKAEDKTKQNIAQNLVPEVYPVALEHFVYDLSHAYNVQYAYKKNQEIEHRLSLETLAKLDQFNTLYKSKLTYKPARLLVDVNNKLYESRVFSFLPNDIDYNDKVIQTIVYYCDLILNAKNIFAPLLQNEMYTCLAFLYYCFPQLLQNNFNIGKYFEKMATKGIIATLMVPDLKGMEEIFNEYINTDFSSASYEMVQIKEQREKQELIIEKLDYEGIHYAISKNGLVCSICCSFYNYITTKEDALKHMKSCLTNYNTGKYCKVCVVPSDAAHATSMNHQKNVTAFVTFGDILYVVATGDLSRSLPKKVSKSLLIHDFQNRRQTLATRSSNEIITAYICSALDSGKNNNDVAKKLQRNTLIMFLNYAKILAYSGMPCEPFMNHTSMNKNVDLPIIATLTALRLYVKGKDEAETGLELIKKDTNCIFCKKICKTVSFKNPHKAIEAIQAILAKLI